MLTILIIPIRLEKNNIVGSSQYNKWFSFSLVINNLPQLKTKIERINIFNIIENNQLIDNENIIFQSTIIIKYIQSPIIIVKQYLYAKSDETRNILNSSHLKRFSHQVFLFKTPESSLQ